MTGKLKLSATLIALMLGTTAPAQAIVTSSFGGIHDAQESGTEFLTSAGSFAGMFNFALTTESLVSYTGFTTLTPFLAFGLYSSAGTFIGGTFFTPDSFNVSVTTTKLAAGSYYFAPTFPLQGPRNALYSFESRATPTSPVPEPSGLPMLLSGLAIVGTIAARRKKV